MGVFIVFLAKRFSLQPLFEEVYKLSQEINQLFRYYCSKTFSSIHHNLKKTIHTDRFNKIPLPKTFLRIHMTVKHHFVRGVICIEELNEPIILILLY